MTAAMRESSMLPCIKCSGCGIDVEISQMGDHVCRAPQKDTSTAGALAALLGLKSVSKSISKSASSKASKPAQIDPHIANKSYVGASTLTPGSSSSGSRVYSPATPRDGQPLPPTPTQSGRLAANEKPSLLPSSMDAAPDPVGHPSRTGPDSPTIPPKEFYAANLPFSPDSSPPPATQNGGKFLLARMNTIAPGPFDVRRGSNDDGNENPSAVTFPERGSSRKYSEGQLPVMAATYQDENQSANPRDTVGTIDSWKSPLDSFPAVPRMTARSDRSSSTSQATNAPSGYRLQRADTTPLRPTPPIPESPSRSKTMPMDTGSRPPRVPPHGGVGLPRTPSQYRKSKETKALPRPPPGESLSPPQPEPPYRPRELSVSSNRSENSVHGGTLSVSSRSTSSAFSHLSKSSMSSHPGSDFSADRMSGPNFVDPKTFNYDQHKRPPIPNHFLGEIDSLMDELNSSVDNLSVSPPGDRRPSVGQRRPSMDQRLASVDERRPSVNHRLPSVDERRPSDAQSRPSVDDRFDQRRPSVDDRHDQRRPSVDDRFDQRRPSVDQRPLGPPNGPPEARQPSPGRRPSHQHDEPPSREPLTPRDNGKSRVPPPFGTSPPISSSPSQEDSQFRKGHKRAPTSKGPCRGCGDQIFGKSVSSADGRLTGRWHKQCFVCQTCREPFQSAEFYVLDNLPFCARHYHELNRSLCKRCDHGIEGPCLETVHRDRFHPNCFTCFECRRVLADDYFEINGRPFCEQHARRFMQPRGPPRPPPPGYMGPPGPGRRGPGGPGRGGGGLMPPGPPPNIKVERRRTRLMFMGEQPTMPGMV